GRELPSSPRKRKRAYVGYNEKPRSPTSFRSQSSSSSPSPSPSYSSAFSFSNSDSDSDSSSPTRNHRYRSSSSTRNTNSKKRQRTKPCPASNHFPPAVITPRIELILKQTTSTSLSSSSPSSPSSPALSSSSSTRNGDGESDGDGNPNKGMTMPTVLKGYDGDGYDECQRMLQQKEPNHYKEMTESVEWIGPALGEEKVGLEKAAKRTFYKEALIDGETIKAGSCILIRVDDNQEEEVDVNREQRQPKQKQRQRRRRRYQGTDERGLDDLDDSQPGMDVNRKTLNDEDAGDGDVDVDIDSEEDDQGRYSFRNHDTQSAGMYKDGDDEETLRGTNDENEDEDVHSETWFGRVMYLFEEEGRRMAHVRYFSQGWQTILMEQASWQELVLLDNCDEVDLESVMGTFQLRKIESTKDLKKEDTYFYRYWYDPVFCVFEGVEKHERDELRGLRGLDRCVCCINKMRKVTEANNKRRNFHTSDFVYFVDSRSKAKLMPFNIGQIVALNDCAKATISIRLLLRHDYFLDFNPRITGNQNRLQSDFFKDCRRLVLTDIVLEIPFDNLEGTCQVLYFPEMKNVVEEELGMKQTRLCDGGQEVKDLESYKDQPDNYWFMDFYNAPRLELSESSREQHRMLPPSKDSLRNSRERLCQIHISKGFHFDGTYHAVQMPVYCLECAGQRNQERLARNKLFKEKAKLVAMDLFSGCGGMTLGLDKSGMVETKFAIEYNEAASKTFKHNLPHVEVINKDAGLVLGQAIAQNGEDKDTRMRKGKDHVDLPKQPALEKVDFIYCGPPCQGFTHASGRSDRSDPRNSLVATAMSFVDFYRPTYVLLENVKGFLHVGDSKQVHQNFFVKFVIRSLTELGYQCRFGMLQAGHYGVPQSRYRFFVWAAKIGYTLPTFPLPMTVFETNMSVAFTPPKNLEYNGHDTFHYLGSRKNHAPDPMVTVRDALSDLPGFELPSHKDFNKNPDKLKPVRKRNFLTVDPFNDPTKLGFNEPDERDFEDNPRLRKLTRYRTIPQSEFQRKLRSKVASQHRIRNHVIDRPRSIQTIERITACPMEPKGRVEKREARLDFEGSFNTITSAFVVSDSCLIHPNQYRPTTIRERARAQGFPDSFVFPASQSLHEWRKQIGNAVPPPLAEALGRMLVEAMVQDMKL
ncbi:hypothetical protein BGZ95_003523, partial [Linnemannia exigua]